MKKKIVFHFFFYKDWRENKVYDIHFRCLEHYKDCFDEAYFSISLEDPTDIDSFNEIRYRLFEIFKHLKRIEFEFVENNILYCECLTFKKEIVDRLGKDDLVFFGHSKGVMDIKHDNPEKVYRTICSLYYLSLENLNEINDLIYYPNLYSYGSHMAELKDIVSLKNKYNWYYGGTFFWINSKKIADYIKINNITLPEMFDRYYAENFLGNLYPISNNYTFLLANSYHGKYVFIYGGHINFDESMNYFLDSEQEKEKWRKFLNEITY